MCYTEFVFKDQISAGEKLAEKLQDYKNKNAIVLAIPRGGVATGYGVVKKLGLPLEVIVTRKIGAPGNAELAIGAVGETEGSLWLNEKLIRELGVRRDEIEKEIKIQKLEIKRRERLYRAGKEPIDLENKVVILIDDGLATGATMMAAAREVRNMKAGKVIVAVPVAPKETVERLKAEVDEVICLETPSLFFAVGQWYEDFRQYSDEEVKRLLEGEEGREGE